MSQHLGRREREARKLRMSGKKLRRGKTCIMDYSGTVTLKLGRKKSMEYHWVKPVSQLKKKFAGCVVDAER